MKRQVFKNVRTEDVDRSSKTQQHIVECKSRWDQKELGCTDYQFGVRKAVCQNWNLVSNHSNLLSDVGLN